MQLQQATAASSDASAVMAELRQEAEAVGAANTAGAVVQPAEQPGAMGQQMDALEALRQEQAQLKREYDRMQVCITSQPGCAAN